MEKTNSEFENPPTSGTEEIDPAPTESEADPDSLEEPKTSETSEELKDPEVVPEDHTPKVPEAPASDFPSAVETTASGLKFGWQQPPVAVSPALDVCVHMGIVQARKQLPNHAVGHQWVCTCGKLFVVILNAGGKKTFQEVENV